MKLPRSSSFTGILLAFLLSVGILFAAPVFAQEVDLESFAEQAGFSTTADITTIIARLIRTAISFIGVIAVVFVIYGGFMFMTAGGNAERVKSAKKIIVNALLGLILVFASFAIVSFILGALTDATSSDIDSSSDGSSSYSDSSSSSSFYLRSVNTDCAEALQNLELQFVFSKSLDEDDTDMIESGIVILEDGETDPVEGTFEISGRTVTFTPTQSCASPYESYFCFDATTGYTIELDATVLESSNSSSLTCTTAYPCSFEFTTGTGVDIEGPTVTMDTPENGESLYQGSIELLQATTTDDTGVSSVDFYLIDDDEALYTSGVDLSSFGVLTGGDVENPFFTDTDEEWATSGYTTNERYDIWATGSDCAGNDDTAESVEIILRAANCNNTVMDDSLGETDVDCGGDDTSSPYYCGACTGDECTESADCSSGQCVAGVCVETPKIESVSAGDGAVGNLITISGEAFGDVTEAGTVTFLATESGDEITASAYSCNSVTQWTDTQIIVQVPARALDGPISVTTTDTTQDPDRTDDDYGPSIADFDVNLIARPGICDLTPDAAETSDAVVVSGNSFGESQGTSTFYFTNYEASTYAVWDSSGSSITVGVPNVNAGDYSAQLFTGDYVCLDYLGDLMGTTCSEDSDCYAVAGTDAGETCATAWCSETLDYCSDDDDCADEDGECESIRVGSNEVAFEVVDTASTTTPIISSIDTGWTMCTGGGSDDGEHCGEDSDCESGVCGDAPTLGPPGQYVTIYGTNFGSSPGSVFLENQKLDYTALGESDFPEVCGEDFWHDTYITIKIPKAYQNTVAIEYDAIHSLYIERQDGVLSDSTDIEVIDDTPGPSVCDIDPSAGPVGTEVTLYGENFGTTNGSVEFYSAEIASVDVWDNDTLEDIVVPSAAVTGPVYVIEGVNSYSSNSMNFEVGDCNEDSDLCQSGETCCSDGSCVSPDSTCEEEESTEAHYAFMVSTGTIPLTPEVVIQCDSTIASPAPWEGWSDPENICVNAAIEAQFDMDMDTGTFTSANITVEKCTAFYTAAEEEAGDGTEGECKTWEVLTDSPSITTSAQGFSWTLSPDTFDPSTTYRVTLNGSGEAGAIQAASDSVTGTAGGYLDGDYSWEFTTSDSTDLCEVGGVNVSPLTESVAEPGDVVYLASLVSADDQCVALSCDGYYLEWESDFDGATVPRGPFGICENDVTAVSETAANVPAIITAEVTNTGATTNPSGDGELTINFTDPEVDEYFPDCSTACVNAMPWAEFNTAMDGNTIDTSTVFMYVCEDSLCAESEIDLVDFVSTVTLASSDSGDDRVLEVIFDELVYMEPNTWYRIVLDGDAILAANGNQLSESGSNYGDDANRYFEDDFSWVFKTKEDASLCLVDSVVVSPDETTATYVGDRAEFDATAYGEPDDCSVDGQALQLSSSTWSAWSASDLQPDAVGDDSGSSTDQSEIVSYMIQDGEIELTSDLPAYCSASCLNIGAPVTTSDGVCGNGTLETYEECDDGATVAGDGCSSSCLDEGADACTYACSDSGSTCTSDSDCFETCENLICSISGSACLIDTDCAYDAGGMCGIVEASCCGDGTRDYSTSAGGEDCDDGDSDSGDGCSSACLNEGARSVGSECGDATQDWSEGTGGEDCDDDNAVSGDGCSSNCLKEGSEETEDVYAICGNGGTPESGEDCDDGNVVNDDGCSSECLSEGTSTCASATSTGCCGNSDVETGEDCDGSEGCSDSCLNEGSSYTYTTPSFCGDGATGSGEECDADTSDTSITFATGAYSVGQIATGAPLEVSTTTGYAISSVSATVDGVTDTAVFQLECSCTTDASCNSSGTTLGCGVSSCCFTRPLFSELYPADNTSTATSAPPGEGYCRNTAIYADFTTLMDEASFDTSVDTDGDGTIEATEFDGNLYLDLESVDGVDVTTAALCPTGYTTLASSGGESSGSPLARAWHWLKRAVLGVFGIEANASSTYDCLLPVTYETVTSATDTDKVYLRYSSLLEAGGIYRLILVGDDDATDTTFDGVLSAAQVALCLGVGCSGDEEIQSFFVGEEICELDYILVEDEGIVGAADYEDASEDYFTSTEEMHSFILTPYTQRNSGQYEEISQITGIYEWCYVWSSSVDDADADDVVALASVTDCDSTTASYTASGTTGEESVMVTATITVDELNETSTIYETTTGMLEVAAIVCENPWPSLSSETLDFPYVEDDVLIPTYFSFYYCRDAGEAGTDDDLPALDDPIEVISLTSLNLLQELIFQVDGSSDAIGVRVGENTDYDSPSAWVEDQDFTGSFSETTLDGYQAVESGTTLYASAANQSGTTIYPNIYVVSYNEDASEESLDIFAQILENWQFNANDDIVTDVNLCSDVDGYVVTAENEYLSCEWDGDCLETCGDDYTCSLTGDPCGIDPSDASDTTDETCPLVAGAGVCDGEKEKLTRDMQRLTDVTDMVATLQEFGEENAYCEVTTDTACETSDDCPGTEDCLLGFPDVQTGTFIPALTNSVWGSWNSAFANELGDTPPTDPVNEFYNCVAEGYDTESCWNGEAGTFICPGNSQVYGYQSSGGIAYTLYTQMETAGNVAWAYDIDVDSTDEATIVAEYPTGTGNAPSSSPVGFALSPIFCDGNESGSSAICGDGTQGTGEACEIGDTKTIECTDSTGEAGLISSACQSDCLDYQDAGEAEIAGAECEPYSCGNGVIETGETCDDGSLNGSYGYCDDNCTYDDAYLCGDGYLAGTEQCDCGETGLYGYSDATADDDDENSWAAIYDCDVSNGQYSDYINLSCAYDCTQPGLSCGDETVNGAEECDGDYEEWEGALCSDGTECTTDSDCDDGSACGDGGAACGTGDVCTDYDDAGEECERSSECDSLVCTDDGECTSAADAGEVCEVTELDPTGGCESGSCPDFNYSLYRYRSCESVCTWPTWSFPCVGGTQICGNGSVEGAEACDDGNSSNNDDCLNTCEANACGDDYVETGVESCDDGEDNGEVCEAGYEDTCNYCNETCQYKTRSGGYCGDEEINGSEVCDGSYSTQLHWFDVTTADTQGSCSTYAATETDYVDTADYTCRWLGVCDGGTENGDYCTLDYTTYASAGTVAALSDSTTADQNSCLGDSTDDTDDGECVPPVCADDCGSSCPVSLETTGLLVQSELSASELTDAISLYSYGNEDGLSPDAASIYIPACTVGTTITATIGDEDITPPDVDIVFVTDITGSMDFDPQGNDYCDGGTNDGVACTPDASDLDDACGSGITCDEYGASVGTRKIDYVVDATSDAIEDLFDAYYGTGSTIRVALVSYTTSTGTGVCNAVADYTSGAFTDSVLVGDTDESSLLSYVESYVGCVGEHGSGPTYNAVALADRILDESGTGPVKIVILLTDGDIDWDDDLTDCNSSYSYPYPSSGYTYTNQLGCVAQIADLFVEDSPYYFYTAAITSSPSEQGKTAHLSSNDCGWEETASDCYVDGVTCAIESASDCTGNYAFAATNVEEIDLMYAAIVDAILGTVVTITATDAAGATASTSGEVQPGENVVLPFPEGFVCDSNEQTMPLRNEFFGAGTMSFSDLEFTYCPYE